MNVQVPGAVVLESALPAVLELGAVGAIGAVVAVLPKAVGVVGAVCNKAVGAVGAVGAVLCCRSSGSCGTAVELY